MAAAASSLLSFPKVPRLTALPRRLSSQGTWKVRIGIPTVRADASFGRARVSAEEKKDMRPIIVIDNYDSFTYNLCQYIGELGVDFEVFRNDELTVEEIRRKNPKGILISPGPGAPQDSGISLQTVVELGPSIPLFGVCMGLQCIGEAFGGKIVRSPSGVRHGKSSLVYYDEKLGEILFDGLSKCCGSATTQTGPSWAGPSLQKAGPTWGRKQGREREGGPHLGRHSKRRRNFN